MCPRDRRCRRRDRTGRLRVLAGGCRRRRLACRWRPRAASCGGAGVAAAPHAGTARMAAGAFRRIVLRLSSFSDPPHAKLDNRRSTLEPRRRRSSRCDQRHAWPSSVDAATEGVSPAIGPSHLLVRCGEPRRARVRWTRARPGGSPGSRAGRVRSCRPGSRATARRPVRPCGRSAGGSVVRAGSAKRASSTSSKPTTLRSVGTARPRSWAARMAPTAIASLMARTAVGRWPVSQVSANEAAPAGDRGRRRERRVSPAGRSPARPASSR